MKIERWEKEGSVGCSGRVIVRRLAAMYLKRVLLDLSNKRSAFFLLLVTIMIVVVHIP